MKVDSTFIDFALATPKRPAEWATGARDRATRSGFLTADVVRMPRSWTGWSNARGPNPDGLAKACRGPAAVVAVHAGGVGSLAPGPAAWTACRAATFALVLPLLLCRCWG
jgi:hypothetical protein